MKFQPRQMIEMAKEIGWGPLIELSPLTGNLRLNASPNDVMAVIELLGGIRTAAEVLGVEEIEIEHWQDDLYVPTRYVARIQARLPGWSRWSLQTPPFDQDASVA
ncbi:MAG: hypothetical protein ACAH21_05095 [Ramlibacter sp.]